MAVRARLDGDLDTLVAVLGAVHREDGYPAYWPDDPTGWLSPRELLGAWVAGERIVGHVALGSVRVGRAAAVWSDALGVPPGGLAAVSRLFVAPEARGVGVGGRLLDAACAAAASRDLYPVLDVVETNRDAIRFYERRGWRRVHSEPWADARDEERTVHYYVSAYPNASTAQQCRPRRTRAG